MNPWVDAKNSTPITMKGEISKIIHFDCTGKRLITSIIHVAELKRESHLRCRSSSLSTLTSTRFVPQLL